MVIDIEAMSEWEGKEGYKSKQQKQNYPIRNKKKLSCYHQLNAILVKQAVIYTTNLRAIYWQKAWTGKHFFLHSSWEIIDQVLNQLIV